MKPLSAAASRPFQSAFRRFEPEIWIVTLIQFFTVIGFSICMPFLSLYLHQERHLSMTLVGTILLAAGLCSAVSQAIGGAFSDRFGRRPILLVATLVSIFLFAALAVVIGISAPVWLIAAVYIAGRSILTTTRPVVSAMLADFTSREKLTEAYGVLRIGANIGWAAGPAIGGYLAGFLPYAWLFAVPALTSGIICLIVFFSVRRGSQQTGERVSFGTVLPPADDRPFLAFTMVSLLLFIVMGQMASTLSIFAVDKLSFSTSQYGLLLTLNGLIVIFFQYPMARALGRIVKSHALILGSLLYLFGYLSYGWITEFGWALGAMGVITAGEIIHSPVSLAVIGELCPQARRGRYMGFYGLSETIGISMGPLVGGLLLDAFPADMRLVWAPIGLIALVAALGYYWWARRFRSGGAG